MIAIKQHPLQALQEACEQAKKEGKPRLVSFVKRINPYDPLALFCNGRKMFYGERFIWMDAARQYTFIGLNHLHVMTTKRNQDRYRSIEKQWKRFIDQSVHKKDMFPTGTGPLLFGGFSFDPQKEQTNLWREFPSGKFIVPQFLYTAIEHEAYFTINVLVTEKNRAAEIVHWLKRVEETLFGENNRELNPFPSKMLHQEEVEPIKWKEAVDEATKRIQRGEIEKVVLARELRASFSQPLPNEYVLQRLMAEQPTSYIFAFESGDDCFIGASPERLVKREQEDVFSTCLAGSIRRGKSEEEDERLGQELLSDEKNLVEHEVVVHMIKEAMMESCKNIEAPSSPGLYKTKHIQHLYTPVKGKIKSGMSLFSLVERLHPTPALGGYPQKKAKQVIRELELLDRGWYGSPLGWLDSRGNGEFIVGIRSGLLQKNEASLFAGCGIVAESDPESEYKETKIKFNPMLSALGGAIHDIH
ncbi:isochorismate synthase MenF [Bacillus songklensis]|uniref:Isochorismate synthase MenF n=1 Tax=Bacillus songklensis TaxID=1069116 RepID=A0ABV8B6B4_9BACI